MLWLSGWSCGIGSCRIKADGLHLQSLPILSLVLSEPLLHQSPSATRRRLVGRASALGRDDRPDAMRPDAAVGLLGVELASAKSVRSRHGGRPAPMQHRTVP